MADVLVSGGALTLRRRKWRAGLRGSTPTTTPTTTTTIQLAASRIYIAAIIVQYNMYIYMHTETSAGGVAARCAGATGLGPPGRRLRGISIDFRLLTSGVYTISFPPLSPRRRYKVLYTLRVHHPFPPTTTAHHPFAEIFHPQWPARQRSWCKRCGVGRVRHTSEHLSLSRRRRHTRPFQVETQQIRCSVKIYTQGVLTIGTRKTKSV